MDLPLSVRVDRGDRHASEFERERALGRANAALAMFETEARNAGISYGLKSLSDLPVEAAATVGALARLHDMTIVLAGAQGKLSCHLSGITTVISPVELAER